MDHGVAYKLWKILIFHIQNIHILSCFDTGLKFKGARLWINADIIMDFNWFSSFRFLFCIISFLWHSVYMASCSINCYSLHAMHTEVHSNLRFFFPSIMRLSCSRNRRLVTDIFCKALINISFFEWILVKSLTTYHSMTLPFSVLVIFIIHLILYFGKCLIM